MNNLKTTNTLLLIIAIPVFFYVLKILSFIFIPLVFAMFFALLFLPLMRFLHKKNAPKIVSIIIVVLLILGIFKLFGMLISEASEEIIATKDVFFFKAEEKLVGLIETFEKIAGTERIANENIIRYYAQKANLFTELGSTFKSVLNSLTMVLTTMFFVVLLLADSVNFQEILNQTILKQKRTSIKAFMQTEKDIITFIKVKFFVSALTGIGFGLACVFFDVSFPIFWGLFAFAINFVQMIGSIIAVAFLSFFGFVEIDSYSLLAFFMLTLTGIQVIFGSILEPLFMGKSFSINVITIIIMLMFWGFIWGIPGLILSIPITVFIKIILNQFPKTQFIAKIIGGSRDQKSLLSKSKINVR